MKIDYDTISDAKYIRIKKGKVAKTVKLKDWLFYDYDKNGDILGVEILNASKNLVSVHTLSGKFQNLGTVDFQTLQDEGLTSAGLALNYKESQMISA